MILVDFSGIAIATIAVNKVNDENMLRHMMLNSLRMYNKKFRSEYGQMILACDHSSWRRDYFPQYKANRRKGRDDSDFDWAEAFRIMHKVKDEIKENFPYKVLHIEGCEADDIIGTMVEHTQEFGQYEEVMIVSSDKDFLQLQQYNNVRQWSHMQKKELKDPTPKVNLIDKILSGDAGDGIPNVLSHDDTFVNGERQTPLSKKKKQAIIEDLADGELLYAASWYRNYCRNEKLIDLSKTPDELREKIIDEFWITEPDRRSRVFPYLINNNMKMLIESVEEFL
jgi:5'-3' exonuclease